MGHPVLRENHDTGQDGGKKSWEERSDVGRAHMTLLRMETTRLNYASNDVELILLNVSSFPCLIYVSLFSSCI
jgi:hypothetical protein